MLFHKLPGLALLFDFDLIKFDWASHSHKNQKPMFGQCSAAPQHMIMRYIINYVMRKDSPGTRGVRGYHGS